MPVMQCAGTAGCGRLISVSAVPGGNPAANDDPEGYASVWTLCNACRSYTCDRCLARQQGRCKCGLALRTLTEPERIAVAVAIASRQTPLAPASVALGGGGGAGYPPSQAQTQPASAYSLPQNYGATTMPGGSTQGLPAVLEGMGKQIDNDIAQNNRPRAAAMCGLAATILNTQGQDAPLDQISWLMKWGEQFYRWGTYAEGAQYWKGVFQLLKRRGGGTSSQATYAVALAGSFDILAGSLAPKSAQAKQVLELAQQALGSQHVLVQDVAARVGGSPAFGAPIVAPSAGPSIGGGSKTGGPGAPGVGPNGWTSGQIPVNMAPIEPPAAPSTTALSASEKLGLWVTLAFLDIASSDGRVGEDEYVVYKRNMQRMQLPDVWDRYGAQGLKRELDAGTLQALSREFNGLAPEARVKMSGLLLDFMMADGKAEPGEISAAQRISAWLGLTLKFE